MISRKSYRIAVLLGLRPSGNLKPSEMDIRLTRKLVEVGKLLELPILDHIILTPEAYFSFADEGLIELKEDSKGRKIKKIKLVCIDLLQDNVDV